MREKLIELLVDEIPIMGGTTFESLADYLIENGVEIPVRCEHCKHYVDDFEDGFDYIYCERTTCYDSTYPDNYCSYGERREE